MVDDKDLPSRNVYRASEVCEVAHIQPYVLRTWEAEFPNLGVPRTTGGRVYRRSDVELVLRIRQLVFEEGLTLAGARRRLEGEQQPPQPELPLDALVTPEVRTRIARVRDGLRDLLAMLGGRSAPRSLEDGGDGNQVAGPKPIDTAEEEAEPALKRARRSRAKSVRDTSPSILDPDDSSQ